MGKLEIPGGGGKGWSEEDWSKKRDQRDGCLSRERRQGEEGVRTVPALTCLLVILGILDRLGVGDALEPAVLSLHQEHCGTRGGISRAWKPQTQDKEFSQTPQTQDLEFPWTPQTWNSGFSHTPQTEDPGFPWTSQTLGLRFPHTP